MALINDKKTKDKKEQQITSDTQLREVIPAYPKILDKRIQPELDRYCFELIKYSTLVVSAYSDTNYSMKILMNKDLLIVDSKTILIPLEPQKRDEKPPIVGTHASLYFLVPGVGHGLRVNGEVQSSGTPTSPHIVLKINRTYLHCARAAARSDLWNISDISSPVIVDQLMQPKQFIALSSYLLMKTENEVGETELSPRGDHAGFVQVIDQHSIFIPERPGNKVAVSARNILMRESIELLMLMPGTDVVMLVRGNATLTKNEQLLVLSIVNNKRPKLGILITQCSFSIQNCSAIGQIQPWLNENQINPANLTRFSKALSIHMNGDGLIGKAATPFINAIVKNDMKHLY